MRNLSVLECDEADFSLQSNLPLTATAFDHVTKDAILAFGPTPEKQVIELKRRPTGLHKLDHAVPITSWDAPCPLPDLACDSILSLHHVSRTSTICLVLAGGDLILVRENPLPDQERIEIVGSIDVGIAAAQWSWDGATLAVVTRAGSLVLMSQDLEPINETSMQQDDLKLSKHVSVGWGKKETQFHGKRAKALKDPTMPEFTDEGKPSPNDDGKTTISWRGDGAFVAVNSTISSPRRVIRVYQSDGVLDSVSEPVDGLESASSWRPHGNLIAGIRTSIEEPSNRQVVFFERNGLRHGQFDMRLDADEINSGVGHYRLCWNVDSSILAIKTTDKVQLWTMNNYHYYLKQEFHLKGVHSIVWHASEPLYLQLSSNRGFQNIKLDFIVDRGLTSVPFDYGLIMVIDGKKLKVTPLKHVNCPPPMAYFEIEAGENIVACTSSRTGQRIALLTRHYLYLCRLQMRSVKSKDASIRHTDQFTVERKSLQMFPRPTQIAIQHDDQVHLFCPARNLSSTGQAFCHKFTWVNTTIESSDLRTEDITVVREARQILADANRDRVFFKANSELFLSDGTASTVAPFSNGSKAEILTVPAIDQDQDLRVSLLDGRLYVNDERKADQVTSYVCTNSYIAYTTANHLLKFMHVTLEHDISAGPDTPEVDERCRAIERGAKIVTVMPSIYAVVLQMPRGNIETIYPRILVLAGIREHIKNLQYRAAFLACQTHQVDMNILYDYNPELWLSNVALFIDQLKKPGRVDEFIQKLREEDVTQTLYKDTSTLQPGAQGSKVAATRPSKVNNICDKMIAELQKRSGESTTNIITAYVCKRPPDLNSALSLVSELHNGSIEEADIAIAHLCFLTDTNRLFDAALALYDLNLTLLVAQNAQRDPREYIPFLQNLQSLSELRRKYTIDNHLRNYERALVSLHAMGEHEELESYTVKHVLYAQATDLYKHDTAHLSTILRLHAEHLGSKSQHAAAATLYESLQDYQSAYPLYTLAHQWREALSCAALVPISPEDLASMATNLATTCVEENRDYRAAATIHLEYLSDPLGAAELLCKSSYFAEAARILSVPSRGLAANIPAVIDPALTKKFGEILELIADCQTQLHSQVPRVEELRIKKAEDPLAFFGGDVEGFDIPDNVSLAPTDASTVGGQSMFTRYGGGAGGSQVSTKFGGTVASNVSRKTSKTKRREERKRARGKKGSVYEEEYLINSVARLIERVNGTHDEVRRLVSGLNRRALRDQAIKVEEVMADMQKACEDARKRVWPEIEEESKPSTYDIDGQGRPSGADGVFYDSQQEVSEGARKETPTVKSWRS